MGASNTITLSGAPVRKEAEAGGTITPGMLVERTSAAVLTVIVHATALGNQGRIFALEDDLRGGGIDDDYASGDRVQLGIFRRGEEVNGILADGQNVVIGDTLASDGAGRLQAHSPASEGAENPEGVVGVALEAVDMSGSSGADPSGRIRVEVI